MRKMKDSGVKWIGEIPDSWETKPIRADFKEVTAKNKYGQVKNALKFTYGEIVSKDNFCAEDDEYVADTILNYTIVEPDTIMLNCLNLNFDFVSQRIGLVKQKGVITSAYLAFKPNTDRIISRYATYLFKCYDNCKAFHNMGGGVRKILNFEELKKELCLFPPVYEQQAISNYLDRKCSEIDALTADIQKQIEMLEEYKRSVITETVTKGLNPDVEMKDSGIEWVGDVPEHWEIIRGKYILRCLNKPIREDDGVITCFRDGEVTLRSNRREDGFTMADKEIGYQGIDVGDLVVHGMDGFAGAIGISDSRGKASPVLNVLGTSQNKQYIMYYLRSMAYNDVFTAIATGIRVRSCDLRWNKLAELSYPVPPIDEQNLIVDYINKQLDKSNKVIALKKQQLETLTEYKKSLIYEYVTGKKEVVTETMVTAIDPLLLLIAKILDNVPMNKGKIRVIKLALLSEYLYIPELKTQYYRYPQGAYDIDIDKRLNKINKLGWFDISVDDSPMTWKRGKKYNEFKKQSQHFNQYDDKIIALIKSIGNYRESHIGRISTLFAVWNDFIIDGVSNPSDKQIIQEVVNNWTPNKARTAESDWQKTLNEMKSKGIIPQGKGLHTKKKGEK